MNSFKTTLLEGDRVHFVRDVDRFPDFIVKAGATGVVTLCDEHTVAVRMDDPPEEAEDGEVMWRAEHDAADMGPVALAADVARTSNLPWCWLCRWVQFTGKPPRIRVCTACRQHPVRGWMIRRKPGDDAELDARDAEDRAGVRT